MTVNDSKVSAASIRMRLLNHARKHGDDYQRVLTRYAIERLLYRLSQTPGLEHYVLKGAMLFATWPEHIFRPSGDLDLLGQGNPDPAAIAENFNRICRIKVPDDGIVFDSATLKVEAVRAADSYQGAKLRLKAELSKAVISVQMDIGFGDHVYPPPKRQQFPILLPELPAPMILMYPPETVVAEKFEAMIRLGEANSRLKDYYDLWVIIRTFRFDLPSLVIAVDGTLRRRDTELPKDLPAGLLDSFAQIAATRDHWSGFLRRNPPSLPPPSLAKLLGELRRFFGPMFVSLGLPAGAQGRWDPEGGLWR